MELNIEQIKNILPHRYPFLLVDRVLDYTPGKSAKAIKCVSANEMQFMGHFPDKAVFPGVLILEALAQTGGIALLTMEENKDKLVFLGGIKNAKYRRQVVPGDVITLECQLIRLLGNVGIGQATASVEGEIACTAEMTFAINSNQ